MDAFKTSLFAVIVSLLAACGGGSTAAVNCIDLPTTLTQVWPTSERPVNVTAHAQITPSMTAVYDLYIGGLHSLNSTNGTFGITLYPTIARQGYPASAIAAEPASIYTQAPGNVSTAFRASIRLNAGQSTTLSIAAAAIGAPPAGVNLTTSSAYVSVCRAVTSRQQQEQ